MLRTEREGPLRIAVIPSPVITTPIARDRVPPGWSGAPEQITFELANGLAGRGHEVTLFATGETQPDPNVTLRFVRQKSSYEDPEIGLQGNRQHEQALIVSAYHNPREYEIYQSALPLETAGAAMGSKTPTVATIHFPITDIKPEFFPFYALGQSLVSVSHGQRQDYPKKLFTENIYHGVDTKIFKFDPHGGDGLVMVGRMERGKGPDVAVAAAQRLNMDIKLVGSNWGDPTKTWGRDSYWDLVMDDIDKDPSHIQLVGHVDREKTVGYYQKAKMTLHPVQVPESFGLSIAESMACGTPVIAFAKGSTPELIDDGVTGFLVDPEDKQTGKWIVKQTGLEGFMEAIKLIYTMDQLAYLEMRVSARKRVEDRFTLVRMVEDYEKLYRRILPRKF